MIDNKPPEEEKMKTTKEECIRQIKNELYMNDDAYTEVKTDLLRDMLDHLENKRESEIDQLEKLDKVLNPDAYYLKEISKTLKEILREMRKRKV